MASADPAPLTPLAHRRRDIAALVLLLLVFLGVAAAFAWPWIPAPGNLDLALTTYAPLRDGGSALVLTNDATGAPMTWEGQNQVIIPPLRFGSDVDPALQNSVLGALVQPGDADSSASTLLARLDRAKLVEVRQRNVDKSGNATNNSTLILDTTAGEFVVGFGGSGRALAYDPPIEDLPADPSHISSWHSSGKFAGSLDYTADGKILERGPYSATLGQFADCLEVEIHLIQAANGKSVSDITIRSWYCAGVGIVESDVFNADGSVQSRASTVSTSEFPAKIAPPAAPRTAASTPASTGSALDPTGWALSRVGRASLLSYSASSTAAPLWVPGNPPLVLGAGTGGNLVAFAADDPGGSWVWQFHPAGPIYGRPTYDPIHHQIYFGAVDKRLYALDEHGVFRWSFGTGDNVAGQPVVVGDEIIVGSEDRTIYGLDAATGAKRWEQATAGAVVSSPAVVGDVAAIGSDDGRVFGLAAATGAIQWIFEGDDAVVAPLAASGNRFLAGSRGGSMVALDVASGHLLWESKLDGAIQSAPAVSGDRVFIVASTGRITSLNLDDGAREWTSAATGYIGPVAVVGSQLIAASDDGAVYLLDEGGKRVKSWNANEVTTPVDGPSGGAGSSFYVGGTSGGGSIWLADNNAVVYRLGPVDPAAPTLLPIAWLDDRVHRGSPLNPGASYIWPVGEYQGKAVVVDSLRQISLLDPATGAGAPIGQAIAGTQPIAAVESVVVGSTLLTVSGATLIATELPTGRPLWAATGDATTQQPPTVVGDTVLWLSAAPGSPGQATGTIRALALATGQLRWQASLANFGFVGGATVSGDTVFVSTPPSAFRLATGERLWSVSPDVETLGGPALSGDGGTLYVGAINSAGDQGLVLAYDASSGHELWRVPLGADALHPSDRIWLSDGTLGIPSYRGPIIGLDSTNGSVRWRYQPPVDRLGNLTVDRGLLWLSQVNGQVVALAPATGQVLARSIDLGADLAPARAVERPVWIGDRLILPLGPKIIGLRPATPAIGSSP